MSASVATPKALTAGTTVVANQSSKLWGVSITAAAAAATLTVYDNASAGSGNIIEQVTVAANATQWLGFSVATFALSGMTAVLTGTGATAIVRYELSA